MPEVTINMQKFTNALERIHSSPHLAPPIIFAHNLRQTMPSQKGNRLRRNSMGPNTLNQFDQGFANQGIVNCLELLQLALRISLHKWNEKDALSKFKENYQSLLNNILHEYSYNIINNPAESLSLLKEREIKFTKTIDKENSHVHAFFLNVLRIKMQNFNALLIYPDITTDSTFQHRINQLTESLYVFSLTMLLAFSDSSPKATFVKLLGVDFTQMLNIQEEDLSSNQKPVAPLPTNVPIATAISGPIVAFNNFMLTPPAFQKSPLQICN